MCLLGQAGKQPGRTHMIGALQRVDCRFNSGSTSSPKLHASPAENDYSPVVFFFLFHVSQMSSSYLHFEVLTIVPPNILSAGKGFQS